MSGPPGRTAMLRQHDEAALRIAAKEQLFAHLCDRTPLFRTPCGIEAPIQMSDL